MIILLLSLSGDHPTSPCCCRVVKIVTDVGIVVVVNKVVIVILVLFKFDSGLKYV